jgi:hypothetical protein
MDEDKYGQRYVPLTQESKQMINAVEGELSSGFASANRETTNSVLTNTPNINKTLYKSYNYRWLL